MTKFKKQLLSVVASSALVLNFATPVFAQTVEITGNGAKSQNTVQVTSGSTTTVQQSNVATVTNVVTTNSSTGGNTASKNTNGDVAVSTGDASSVVAVQNTLNSNDATVGCCGNTGLNALISGNGADSVNRVTAGDEKSATNVVQSNGAFVGNFVTTNNDTGLNTANKNNGGDVTVMTGDAKSTVGVSTTANSNTATVGGSSTPTVGGVSAVISGNGADSVNSVGLTSGHSTGVYQDNSAFVTNMITSGATTGENRANKNTGGDTWLETGDAVVIAAVVNKLNANEATVNCCASDDALVQIVGNGADSKNTVTLGLGGSTVIAQGGRGYGNSAFLMNLISADMATGLNNANRNTNGDVVIMTGDASALLGVDNMVNFNVADVDCCQSGADVKIGRNGADTVNTVKLSLGGDNRLWQDNLAFLTNVLGANGETGENRANENTGGVLGFDPAVVTGDSSAIVSVVNSGNVNDAGGAGTTVPSLEFGFDVNWNWAMMFALFQWL